MVAINQMEPDTSPGYLSEKSGVRRVNNMPIYIISTVVVLFLVVMFSVAMNRADKQNEPAEEEIKRAGSTSMFANELTSKYASGIVEPEEIFIPPEEVFVADLNLPPTPPKLIAPLSSSGLPSPSKVVVERNPLDDYLVKMKREMFENAVRSGTKIKTGIPQARRNKREYGQPIGDTNSQSPSNRNNMLAEMASLQQEISSSRDENPTASFKKQLEQIKTSGILDAALGVAGISISNAESYSSPRTMANKDRSQRWDINAKIEAPHSQYELRAGFVIPGTLILGINSELPGQITAQVSQNVYDTATGRHLLIPQGSRISGIYSSTVQYGQSRVLVAWRRIIFPDGKVLDIGEMPGADSAGYSGFKDKTNNHYLRIFGSAVLMSAVVAGINLSQDNGSSNGNNSQRSSDALSESLGRQMGEVTTKMIEKNLTISPTLEIRPGYRFNITITKDMVFSKAYQSFDY